jgi:hypothetical protein
MAPMPSHPRAMKGSTVISIQVSPKSELLAELGAECPDDRDVEIIFETLQVREIRPRVCCRQMRMCPPLASGTVFARGAGHSASDG